MCTARLSSGSTGRCPTSTPGTRHSRCSRPTSCSSNPLTGYRSGDELRQCARRDGAGKQEALSLVALVGAQGACLLGGLDALGYDLESQVVAEGNDGADNGGVVGFGCHVLDKRAVDLQAVHGKALQVRQARIAGAEIIDGNLH